MEVPFVRTDRLMPTLLAIAAFVALGCFALGLGGCDSDASEGARATVASGVDSTGSAAGGKASSEAASQTTSSQASSSALPQASSSEAVPALASSVPALDGSFEGSKLTVRFLDVGQGDCALLSCDGHHALIDGGPSDASQVVYTVLKDAGIEKLDFIVATHADADHIGGISGALNYASCPVVYCSVAESDTDTFASMVKYLQAKGGQLVVPNVPARLQLGGATLDIVGPVQAFEDDNNTSLVCRVEFGSTSFLFMGDAEHEAEDALLASGATLRANVLKVGHHGSANSTSQRLLDAVQPTSAVISVGAGNGYGHPTQEVLDALTACGATVYRTDTMGDVTAESDGTQVLFNIGTKRSNTGGASSASQVGQDQAASGDAGAAGSVDGYKHSDMAAFMSALPEGTVLVKNTNTGTYHKPSCKSLKSMKGSNALAITNWDDARADWDHCGNCKPELP